MDWLTFVAEIVKATAWPAAVLLIVFILRKPLVALLPLLTKFKWKDFEFEFGKQIAEAQADASSKLPPAPRQPALIANSSNLSALLDVSPRAAILEAWIQVDRTARDAVVRHNLPQPVQTYVSPSKIVSGLESAGLVQPEHAALVHDLRALRNQAAHAPEFALTKEAAQNYVDLAARLVDHLNSI